jgi:hypothetical protein|uniref:Uncharacterized protein At4g36655 n=1 Tax=Arabidopsis thaliana TaxID=3702 RepID=Q8H108_ARATH|nr:unknown protein [Arabidopsis thaliana]
MNPVGSNGSSSSSGDGCAAVWRSEVTKQRGVSWARRWKRWWFCVCRSSITRPQDEHSVIDLPELVVVHRPCADEQYGHFIFVFLYVCVFFFFTLTCECGKAFLYYKSKQTAYFSLVNKS